MSDKKGLTSPEMNETLQLMLETLRKARKAAAESYDCDSEDEQTLLEYDGAYKMNLAVFDRGIKQLELLLEQFKQQTIAVESWKLEFNLKLDSVLPDIWEVRTTPPI